MIVMLATVRDTVPVRGVALAGRVVLQHLGRDEGGGLNGPPPLPHASVPVRLQHLGDVA